ncbi:ankyrin [Gonapodya prolifera JEL478]|uniref:Ankyrin n=1 Tax=Gonapodya prolifera (strain JEL478) TaxID=1344416 RepID=A0A139A910_GONPJ|nr:ankyrin [Gonapodya prolifera JEL478]|eukprot:KXS12883.1 ankyrin [Gonapodya prolifera JEL478]
MALATTIPEAKILLNRGALINNRDFSGFTALMNTKDPEMAAFLVDRGADANIVNRDGYTALSHHTMWHGAAWTNGRHCNSGGKRIGSYESVDLCGSGRELCGRKQRNDTINEHRENAKVARCHISNQPLPTYQVDAAIMLLDAGADVNQRDKNGRTALRHAIEPSHGPVADFLTLLLAGSDPNCPDLSGILPVCLAAMYILVKDGISLNCYSNREVTSTLQIHRRSLHSSVRTTLVAFENPAGEVPLP